MLHRRLIFSLGLAGIAFLTVNHRASVVAQPPKESTMRDTFYLESPQWPPELRQKVFEWKSGEKELNVKENPKAAKDLELLAKIIIYKVTDRKYYSPSIEHKFGFGKTEQMVLANPESDQTLDGVMTEINRYVLVPNITEKSPYFKVAYIEEFGKAADAAIRDVLKKAGNEPRTAIVRVNAGRALASVCRSGASAHVPLLIELIKNETTPPELQYWALKASENLIAASDLIKATEGRPEFHALKDKVMAPLVIEIEKAFKRYSAIAIPHTPPAPPPGGAAGAQDAKPPVPPMPPMGAGAGPKPPMGPPMAPPPGRDGKIETNFAPPFDVDVAMFLRRHAVRAISKCRKVYLSDSNETLARPGVFLAKLAVYDPSIVPVAQPYECADAAIGLAQMVPDNNVHVDVQLDAIAAAISTFGAWKVTGFDSKESKVVLWRKTATAMSAALATLKAMPDKAPIANQNRQRYLSLVDIAMREIVEPIRTEQEGVASTAARPDELNRWRKEPSNQRQTDLLIRDDKLSQVTLPKN
ncbi:MAG: hypothetical protein U0798_13860 [Gemmataceae bacterium]